MDAGEGKILPPLVEQIAARDAGRMRQCAALTRWAEQRVFCESPNVFLCVSSSNRGAQRLYRRLGYQVVGRLRGFIAAEHDEILLRKTIGPRRGFRSRGNT
jgi:ribosomal protein S18 acetylase RimI-like enzyme